VVQCLSLISHFSAIGCLWANVGNSLRSRSRQVVCVNAIEGILSHFLPCWLMTGWHRVSSKRKMPWKYSTAGGNWTRAAEIWDKFIFPLMYHDLHLAGWDEWNQRGFYTENWMSSLKNCMTRDSVTATNFQVRSHANATGFFFGIAFDKPLTHNCLCGFESPQYKLITAIQTSGWRSRSTPPLFL